MLYIGAPANSTPYQFPGDVYAVTEEKNVSTAGGIKQWEGIFRQAILHEASVDGTADVALLREVDAELAALGSFVNGAIVMHRLLK